MTDDIDDRPTSPCPPPAEPWPGLDEDTASEAPRALTPVPGSGPKKRSGEWLLHDACHKDPPGARPAKSARVESAAELCARLGFDEPGDEQRRRNLGAVDDMIAKPLPGYPPKLPAGTGRDR